MTIELHDRVTLGQPRSGCLVYTVEALNGDRAVIADSSGKRRSVAADRLVRIGGRPAAPAASTAPSGPGTTPAGTGTPAP